MGEGKEKKSWSWLLDIFECSELLIDILIYGSKGLIRLVFLLCEFLGDWG
jgi:hypothetical protein